jgi:psiF repeat
MLMRSVFASGFLAVLVSATPAAALTAAEKMETCKFGADHQKLAGEARKKFLTKCMAEVAPAPAAAAKSQ